MIQSIKSLFFTKLLFSFLKEKSKLELIKCNKTIQNAINISITHYKHFKGNYIIYQGNGIGKEYNGYNNLLCFEGTYINCKRNGKGKEYDLLGNVTFEGEYLNGKRNGKGKEYFDDGQVKFEGEYIDDQECVGTKYNWNGQTIYTLNNMNGHGREYDDFYDKISFEGEYLNGRRNGKGKEYDNGQPQQLIFEGEYLNGKRNGKGKEYISGILIFEGEYLDGKKWNGKGYDFSQNLVYELKNGKGYIKKYSYNGTINHEGEYLYGTLNGIGKEYDNGGNLISEGEYIDGKRNGKGNAYYNGKLYFESECYNNFELKGKFYVKGKLEYEGEFLYGRKWNGKGYDEKGNVIYELKNGNGKVREYDNAGNLLFEGEYSNGRRNGKGKEYSRGKLIFEGEYLNGHKIN